MSSMDLATYRHYIESISYGERLPSAIYLIRPEQHDVSPELWRMFHSAEVAAQPDAPWNVLEIHTHQPLQ